MAQRDFAEIAPGEFAAPCPPKFAPKVGVVKFMRVEAGLFQPVIQAMPVLATAATWKEELMGCGWRTARMLAYAGFVEYSQPAPSKMGIQVESWLEHLAAVRRDPNFWTTERRQRLAEARNTLTRAALMGDDDMDEEEAAQQASLF